MFKRVWPLFLLLAVSCSIAFFNVQKGTWLIGWDSTQPELNFPLNLSRGFSAVWQEYRGLGVTDGMAHGANLIHLVYAWVISEIVDVMYVRYAFVLLVHVFGGVGMYMLLRFVGRVIGGEKISRWVAFAGALFYMLNPYALQMFYQPLELFVAHFAALPWLTFTLIQYISKPNKKNIALFALANILTLSQAHVPTLFIVWIMLAGLILLPALLWRTKRYGKQILMVMLVSVGIHAFWGLPYIYSAINNARNIGEAKINVLSNPEVILRNDAFGDIRSIVKMQGFTLSFEDWNEGYVFGLQMPEWVNWWGQEWVLWVMGAMMILASVGITSSLKHRKWWTIGIVLMYLLALGNLGARIPYIREIGLLLREHVPYYEAIFRFTFTKFALVYAFVFTILMAIGILSFYRLVRGWMSLMLSAVVIAGVIAVSWPGWQGQFFYHNLKLQVPGEYQSLFKFFEAQSEGRVLPLPYPDFWGWQSNEWGYRGSGFVWQGIVNPTLYGSFNAWSPYNEGFYNEISTALYRDNKNVERVLDKYDVRYVLLDESVIAPGQDKKILRNEETKELAKNLGWQERFHEGFLTVWEVPGETQNQFVSAIDSYTTVEADTTKVRQDVVWSENGHYISSSTGLKYPFAKLMREETAGVTYGQNVATVREQAGAGELIVPPITKSDVLPVLYRARMETGTVTITFEPFYRVNDATGPILPEMVIPLPKNEENIWVTVGTSRTNAIYLENGKSAEGQVELTVGAPIPVYIYAGTTSTTDKLGTVFVPGNVQKCWEAEDDLPQKASGSVVDGALKLVTRNASACLPIQLAASKGNELIQVIAKYKSPDNVRPSMCLDLVGEPYRCENQLLTNTVASSADWAGFMRTVRSEKGQQYWLDLSSESLEPRDVERALYYQVPLVARYQEIASDTIEASAWGSYTSEQVYRINDTVEIAVPGIPFTYDFAHFGRLQPANCDVLRRGEAIKNGVTYSADHYGAVCDYVEMPDLSTKLSYLLRLAGEDKQGRSIKFFLADTGSSRNDLEYLLNKNSFDQTFGLLPWQHEGHYFLNIETRSFGNATTNTLDRVEARYFPLDIITRAHTLDDSAHHSGDLAIKSVGKSGTWLYRVISEGSGLMKLSQGHDKGWVAIGIRDKSGVDLPHVKVDGWANGWMVPEGVHQVVVFYWPQLLEYLGFVLLAVTFVVIIRK